MARPATEHIFRVWQDGIVVAAVYAPDYHSGLRDIAHYAHQYEQDGPIRLDYRAPRKRRPKQFELAH